MRILLTGALGNIGQNVLTLLLQLGHEVRCFDIRSEKNEKLFSTLTTLPWRARKVEMLWGDIREQERVNQAVENVQAIIHLAALIPPLSEKQPELAREINVQGTQNLIKAALSLEARPLLIFSSSISIYGPRMAEPPPRTALDPVHPTDNYTHHKVECERMIKESGLPWTFLRVGVVSVTDVMGSIDPIIFEIPLDQRLEFIHSRDVARACVNALSADVQGKTLLIGGGETCRMLQRDFLKGALGAAGLGVFPDTAFIVPRENSDWFYTDYMDTEESQKLLHYQVCSFADYIMELEEALRFTRIPARLFRPVILFFLSLKSPYYRKHLRKKLPWARSHPDLHSPRH